jgi:hypothetical protein
MTIAIATGGRRLRVTHEYWPLLDAARESYRITKIWHGAAKGADEGVELWANARGLDVERFPAPWDLFKAAGLNEKAAGMHRNADMFDGRRGYAWVKKDEDRTFTTTEQVHGRPELLLALPGYKGTRGAIRLAAERQIPVERIMVEPMVVNRWWYARRDKSGYDFPPGTVSIMRGDSALGNPFRVGDPHPHREGATITGDECLGLYRLWLHYMLYVEKDRGVIAALSRIGSKDHLACACLRPDGTGLCHGQVVLRAWRHWNHRPVDGPGALPEDDAGPHDGSLQPNQ